MNKLKNKDGSAILWTVLFTNILAILLGSLLTLSYEYHKATIETVKSQQAYFTARSATDAIISDITVNGSDSKLMPIRVGKSIELKNISFDMQDKENDKSDSKSTVNMGSADAVIKKESEDAVSITVNSKYADSTYRMTAKLRNQSVYFGGLAINNLNLYNNNKLVLGEGTDLYYDGDGSLDGQLKIGGNLIAKHDINLKPGSEVSGITFSKGLHLDDETATTHPKKLIWNPKQFIISNYEIKNEDIGKPKFVQTKKMLIKSILKGNYTRKECNNAYLHPKPKSLLGSFIGNVRLDDAQLVNNVRYIKVTNRTIGRFNLKLDKDILYADDYQFEGPSFNPFNWYLDPEDSKHVSKEEGVYYSSYNPKTALDLAKTYILPKIDPWSNYVYMDSSVSPTRYYLKDCFDAEYIDYKTSSHSSNNDKVSSVAYVLIEKGCKMRIKYGSEPDRFIIGTLEDFYDLIMKNKITYLIVYLGEDAVLDLGSHARSDQKDRLKFFMSVYGETGSKLVLHNNVSLFGSVYVDTLDVKGYGNKIEFMSQNGGKVAKQKVDELWTLSNYSG